MKRLFKSRIFVLVLICISIPLAWITWLDYSFRAMVASENGGLRLRISMPSLAFSPEPHLHYVVHVGKESGVSNKVFSVNYPFRYCQRLEGSLAGVGAEDNEQGAFLCDEEAYGVMWDYYFSPVEKVK